MRLLVILDGASEPLRTGVTTSLERADTPTLDALAANGTLSRVKTVADGLLPGSEVAIPALLGWVPTAPVDRGAIEAAAHGVAVPDGERAWRIDVRCPAGGRAGAVAVARAAGALRTGAPGHAVHALGGHRLLLVGPSPLPGVAAGARGLKVWPEGGGLPSGALDERDVIVAARGACAGVARLLGASVVHPDGATGDVDTDLRAKVAAARAVIADARLVVVHVAGADEAAHRHDAEGKFAFLERVDRELIAPLADTVRALGATLSVQPDHGCDPATGTHDALAVPALVWNAAMCCGRAGRRLTERAVADLPLTDLTTTDRTLVTAA